MRTILTAIIYLSVLSFMLGQAPQGINYQAVARDANGVPSSSPVGVTFKIFDNSTGTGGLLFSETHPFITSSPGTGLFNLTIGTEKPTEFAAIDWAIGSKFLQVTINNEPGPITQMMSVPYALYAASGAGTPGPQGETGPSGPQGQQGETGPQGIQGSTGPIGPQGPSGQNGVGISSTIDNGNGTITFHYTDGSTFTTSNLTGPQGVQGQQGPAGLQGQPGPQGPQGPMGQDGVGISSIINNGNGTLTFQYTNGNTFTTPNLTGPQGLQGAIGQQGPAGPIGPQGIQGLPGAAYSPGVGINISNNIISNTGDTNPNDDLTNASNAGGDISGVFSNLQIKPNTVGGNELATMGAFNGQVLKFSNGSWAPGTDLTGSGGTYTAGTGISIIGNTITNTGDTNPNNDITTSSNAGGDLSGVFSNLQIKSSRVGSSEIANGSIQGVDLSQMGAFNGDVLGWDGSSWGPTTVSGGYIVPNAPGLPGTGCSSGFLPFDCSTCVTGSQFTTAPAFRVTNLCNGTGIEGRSESTASIKAGVKGTATGAHGNGVWGECNNGIWSWGVYGKSTQGYGVVGWSSASSQSDGLFGDRIIVSAANQPSELVNWAIAGPYAIFSAFGVSNTSDKRLKKNIEPIEYGLKAVLDMKPVSFNWNVDTDDRKRKNLGFIAQDMQTVVPDIVITPTEEEVRASNTQGIESGKGGKTGEPYLGMNYQELTPVLVKAIQEQQAHIEDLKTQLKSKDEQMAQVLQRLEKLEKN